MKYVLLFLLIIFTFSFANTEEIDEVIVFFKDGTVSAQSVIEKLQVKKHKSNKFLVKKPENKTLDEFIKELKRIPQVEYVVPNYKIKKLQIPNDPFYPKQWYLKNVDIERAWDITTGSEDVYVAVLDTGVDYNHPDLKDNIWLNTGEMLNQDSNNNGIDDGCENDIDDDNNGYIDDCYGYNAVAGKGSALDDDGHGTNVAGIIGAIGNNGIGVSGVNWKVKIVPCKFLDSNGYGDLDALLECLNYVKSLKDKGLNIVAVNASYGYKGDIRQLNEDCSIVKSSEKCLMASIDALFIIASGNGGFDFIGDNNDVSIFLPCNYSTVIDNIICVGATNSSDRKSSFSNFGYNTVNIFAPGGEIVTSQECIPEEEILNTWKGDNIETEKYGCAIGTSQAAPIVAGTVALIKASNPNLSIAEIKERILTTGDTLPSLFGYSSTCSKINVFNALSNNTSPKICISEHFQDVYGVLEKNVYNTVFKLEVKNSGIEPLIIDKISYEGNIKLNFNDCVNKSLNSFEKCSIEVEYLGKDNSSAFLHIENNSDISNLTLKINFVVSLAQENTESTASIRDDAGSSNGCNGFSIFSIFPIFAVVFFRRTLSENLRRKH